MAQYNPAVLKILSSFFFKFPNYELNLGSSAVKAQFSNHWFIREFPHNSENIIVFHKNMLFTLTCGSRFTSVILIFI